MKKRPAYMKICRAFLYYVKISCGIVLKKQILFEKIH